MENSVEHNHIDPLILRHISGEISEAEARELLNWVKASSNNKSYFEDMLRVARAANTKNTTFNHSKAYQQFRQQTTAHSQRSKTRTLFMRFAAAAAILVALALVIYTLLPQQNTPLMVESHREILEHTLPDSSTVIINQDSKLCYQDNFKNKRVVQLTGNAFFDVTPDKKRPFDIYVGDVLVEVLGTSFNVAQDTLQNSVTVSVVTGLVRVSCPQQNIETLLHPNQRCVINCTQGFTTDSILPTDNYLSWVTNKMQFKNASLNQVVSDLNRHFNTNIQVATPELGKMEFSSTLENQQLEDVLMLISLTLDIEVIETNELILLKGKK